MEKRYLGKSGIAVSPLALGGNVFGWTVDEPNAFAILDSFVQSGFNLIDTADVYPRWVSGNKGGESEAIIGKWMKERGNRHLIVLATKGRFRMWPGPTGEGLSRAHLINAAEDSLRRLQTDVIDLYQSHRDNPSIPIEETLEAYEQLIKEGKVRAIGASNFTPERLVRSLEISREKGLPRYESLQPLYNLYDRMEFERTLAPLCRRHGLGVITYSSLASGFLTGKYRSDSDLGKSVRGQKAGTYLTERGRGILEVLDTIAKRYHAKPATIALAWLMAQPGITAPIASATGVGQLLDLIAAVDITLDRQEIELLNRVSKEPSPGKKVGVAA